MLGIGAPEIVVIALIFLVIFGPSKMPQMARDIGKFVSQARGAIDEFKDELTTETTEDEAEKRPSRSREEGSRRRANRRGGRGDHHPEDDPDGLDDPDEFDETSGSSADSDEPARRRQAEYDL